MKLCDAHCHLHDPRLAGVEPPETAAAVVNGTRESDWAAVDAWCAARPWARRSFGLHPWHAAARTPGWLERLEEWLVRHPKAVVGEIGLDRWIEGHHLPTQREVFAAQLALAARLRRPVTIHCLRAWGALAEELRAQPVPKQGFLLHAYGGPAEMVEEFARLGAYFSYSAYFLHERKGETRALFQRLPAERLLVETDAPDMAPPPEQDRYRLKESRTGVRLNHPGHLRLAYESLAALRGTSVEELAETVAANFFRLFGE